MIINSLWHAFMSFAETLFSWPDGIVVGNLIASVLWVPLTFIHLHRKIDKKLDAHLEKQTADLKDHMTTEIQNAGQG